MSWPEALVIAVGIVAATLIVLVLLAGRRP